MWKNSTMSCDYALRVNGELQHKISYISKDGEARTVSVTKMILDGLTGKPIPEVDGQVMVVIKKVNNDTGKEYSVVVEGDKYVHWKHSDKRPHVQDVFPDLGPEQREFLMTGMTPEEWDEDIGPDPDEEGER